MVKNHMQTLWQFYHEHIAQHGLLGQGELLDFACQIATQIANSHGSGIILGNINAHNIYVCNQGILTYIINRDIDNKNSFDPLCDIHDFGKVLQWLLTGKEGVTGSQFFTMNFANAPQSIVEIIKESCPLIDQGKTKGGYKNAQELLTDAQTLQMFYKYTPAQIIDMYQMEHGDIFSFYVDQEGHIRIKNINLPQDTTQITIPNFVYGFNTQGDFSFPFGSAYNLNKIHFTKHLKDMSYMFSFARIIHLDCHDWDLSHVTNMSHMFQNAVIDKLDGIELWDTCNVTNMEYMFDDSRLLCGADLKCWNVENVTSMNSMFSQCSAITVGDLHKWNTSHVKNMSMMFYNSAMEEIGDLSHWNTSNVTDMSYMFEGVRVKSIGDISQWNTCNLMEINGIFNGVNGYGQYDCHGEYDFAFDKEYRHHLSYRDEDLYEDNLQEDYFKTNLTYVGNLQDWNVAKVKNLKNVLEHSFLENKDEIMASWLKNR